MTAVKFFFDAHPERVFSGFAAGGTWNGCDNVAVTLETAHEIDTMFADLIASGDADRIAEMPVTNGLINLSGGFATHIVPNLVVGARVRLTTDVDRFPHFFAPAGLVGTVVESSDFILAVRMDRHIDGCEDWDNQVYWCFSEDQIPWDEVEAV